MPTGANTLSKSRSRFCLHGDPMLMFVPICLSHLGLDQCLDLGRALAQLIEDLGEDVGLVASSDMSHYVEDGRARILDRMAIDAALKRDPKTLYQTVHREGITMCGVVPATVVIEAANHLGAAGAHLVAYATSGDVSRRSISGRRVRGDVRAPLNPGQRDILLTDRTGGPWCESGLSVGEPYRV